MSDHLRQPTGSRVLDALPPKDFARLAPRLESIDLRRGQDLHEMGGEIEHAYFPTHGMISLVSQVPAAGSNIEVGLIGWEGMAGVSSVLGVDRSPQRAMVQIPGGGFRVGTDALRAEFRRGGVLQELLLRYTHALLLQLGVVAGCNRLHHMEERLARWLLMASDRTGSGELPLTQEFIAMMLGVRRAGVTKAALALQKDGLIHYSRGHVTISDREGLEDLACDCYPIIKAEFDRLPSNGRATAGG